MEAKARGTHNARIAPVSGLDVLSRLEVSRLRDATQGGLTRCCAAARSRCSPAA